MERKIKLMIVLGSGGHTTEMFNLVESLDKQRYWPRIYIHASTDEMSRKKVDSLNEDSDVIRF